MNTLPERYQQKIIPEPNSGCWLWIGMVQPSGYGLVWQNGTMDRAHRAVYKLIKGPIPSGLHLDHLCRLRCCVNPDHLEPVTPLENTRRGLTGINKRNQTHCNRGHEFTKENTRKVMCRGVWVRQCRQCDVIRRKKWTEK